VSNNIKGPSRGTYIIQVDFGSQKALFFAHWPGHDFTKRRANNTIAR
jgi:hypothetical protein